MFKYFSLLLYSLVQQSHNDFSVRVLRVVSLMEEKEDINYHQVKITTINVFIASEGSNLCE